MISRRMLLLSAAAAVVTPASASETLSWVTAEALETSRSFDGPGWYLFGRQVFWASPSSSEFFPGFIDLAHRPGGAVAVTMAPGFFDETATAKHVELDVPWAEGTV